MSSGFYRIKPVLRIYNPKLETELHADASADGYRAVLLQRNPKDYQFHSIHYISKKTTPTERKYHSYYLEILAIATAAKKFRVYLLGIHFKIVTDCSALTMTLQKKELPPRLARWAMLLEEFDNQIEHRAGSRMTYADDLSRYPKSLILDIDDTEITAMKKAQSEDELIRKLAQKNKFVNVSSTAVRNYNEQQKYQEQQYRLFEKVITVALIGSVVLAKYLKDKVLNEKHRDNADFEAGMKIPGLPAYRIDEVSKHMTKDNFWVIYKHGVYDISKYLPSHPGGDEIMGAAGASIEPFWNVYGMHKIPEIYRLLESYRIGNLHDEDLYDYSNDELWANEPLRDPRLIVKTINPFNAETPAKLLIRSLDTPKELFFVRQHMHVPELDSKNHILHVRIEAVESSSTKQFKIQDLQKLIPPREVRAALMCSGNRRTEMNMVRTVHGLHWQQGAISNAVWSGVYLRDVLEHCGLDTTDTAGKHVNFTGSDVDITGLNFNASIPLVQALNPNGEIILATHMNGEPLSKDHGYPLRVIVPGETGFRSVKWLGSDCKRYGVCLNPSESISVSCEESQSHWHQRDYKMVNPSTTWETANFYTALAVYGVPVTSSICDPADGDVCTVKNGILEVRGYAYSGGGAKILRVDVSPDRGRTWHEAEETESDDAPPDRHYSWTLWTARIPVQKGQTEVELWVKALDSSMNTQPEEFRDIWNVRGLLGNGYHKIKVQIKH